jgi:hypothetical protein
MARLAGGCCSHLFPACQFGTAQFLARSQQQVFRADLDAPWFASIIIALLHGVSLQLESYLDTFDLERLGAQTLAWLTGQ